MVRITLPFHLQTLANCAPEVEIQVPAPITVKSTVRALETRYPMLSGAIIDHNTGTRRPKVRFFACAEDVSLGTLEEPLPDKVAAGEEPLIIIGAISGG